MINDKNPYDDILNLPRPVSERHPQMSRSSRAAQFAPFAALTGYEDAVMETARRTEDRIEHEAEALALLDRKMLCLSDHLDEHPFVTVTYFVPDQRKVGGEYRVTDGNLARIDPVIGRLLFTDRREIKLGDILDVESEIFAQFGIISD